MGKKDGKKMENRRKSLLGQRSGEAARKWGQWG